MNQEQPIGYQTLRMFGHIACSQQLSQSSTDIGPHLVVFDQRAPRKHQRYALRRFWNEENIHHNKDTLNPAHSTVPTR